MNTKAMARKCKEIVVHSMGNGRMKLKSWTEDKYSEYKKEENSPWVLFIKVRFFLCLLIVRLS